MLGYLLYRINLIKQGVMNRFARCQTLCAGATVRLIMLERATCLIFNLSVELELFFRFRQPLSQSPNLLRLFELND